MSTKNPTTADVAPPRDGEAAPRLVLRDGHTLPALGLGTWPMDDDDTARAVEAAVAAGYRHVDTAMRYHNEEGVGRGLRATGLPREQWSVASKLRGGDHGRDQTLRAFEATRRNLGVDVVDLYLIHWPLPRLGLYVETWQAMRELRDEGLIRSLGVSNFTAEHLRRLADETGELPAVNQVEMHLGWRQDELREQCTELGVTLQAWGPMGRGKGLLDRPEVTGVADAHGVTPAQVTLRWLWEQGVASAPKSSNPQRLAQNIDIFGFELTDTELETLAGLPQERLGKDPDVHEEY